MALTVGELMASIGHLPANAVVVVEAGGIPLHGPITVEAAGAGVKAHGPDQVHAAVVRVDVSAHVGKLVGFGGFTNPPPFGAKR